MKEVSPDKISVVPLGQTGFRFGFDDIVVYIDPYLSDRVSALEGEGMRRLMPPKFKAHEIKDAGLVLITHIHADHCDPESLLPMHEASTRALFMGPNEAVNFLHGIGMDEGRLRIAACEWFQASDNLRIRPVSVAHPEPASDEQGLSRWLGYVFEYRGRRIFHAGDTSPHDSVIEELRDMSPFDVVFLPVNERNYYRERRGIIGNMSIREAFEMAAEMNASTLVPMHWDMFEPNSVFREEIELLYGKLKPPFAISINPELV